MPSLHLRHGREVRLRLRSSASYEIFFVESGRTVAGPEPITPDEINAMIGGRPWRRGDITVQDGSTVTFSRGDEEWGRVPQLEWDRLVDEVLSEDDALAG
jgi:hypothetical protein